MTPTSALTLVCRYLDGIIVNGRDAYISDITVGGHHNHDSYASHVITPRLRATFTNATKLTILDDHTWTIKHCSPALNLLRPQCVVLDHPLCRARDPVAQTLRAIKGDRLHAFAIRDVFRTSHLYQCIAPFQDTLAILDIKRREGHIEIDASQAPSLPVIEELAFTLPRSDCVHLVGLMQPYMAVVKRLHIDAKHCAESVSLCANAFGEKLVTLGAGRFTSSLADITPLLRKAIFLDDSSISRICPKWYNLPKATTNIVCYVRGFHNFAFDILTADLTDGAYLPDLRYIHFIRDRKSPKTLMSGFKGHSKPMQRFIQFCNVCISRDIELHVEGQAVCDAHAMATLARWIEGDGDNWQSEPLYNLKARRLWRSTVFVTDDPPCI